MRRWGDENPAPSPEPEPSPDPEPDPGLDHVLIIEAYYDVDAEHGAETTNEWVELYNGTDESVNISGWIIADSITQRVLRYGLTLESGQYAVIVKDETTMDHWSIPQNALTIVLGSAIGNGLG